MTELAFIKKQQGSLTRRLRLINNIKEITELEYHPYQMSQMKASLKPGYLGRGNIS